MSRRPSRRLTRPSRSSRSHTRCQRPSFHVERLEDRLLMSADDALLTSVALAFDATPAALATDKGVTADTPIAQLERFASVEELKSWLIDAAVAQWEHLFGQDRKR